MNTSRPPGEWIRQAGAAFEKWMYFHGLRSTEGLRLPDFLGIGAQKAGTSWVYENLRHHPDVYMPERKELHYFDWNFSSRLESYCSKFAAHLEKMAGEITPGYSVLPLERIAFIHKIMPNVRLFFLMRNPIDRAWSQAIMNLVVHRGRRYQEVEEWEFYAHFKSEASQSRGDYEQILKNWLGVFPREQLYIGFFEEIAARPKELLSGIFAHIGISTPLNWHSLPYNQIIHKGAEAAMPEKFREALELLYRPKIEKLNQKFGQSTAGW